MTRLLLRLLRVPPEPQPPAGSPESVRVFRAGRNLYYWNLLNWAFIQAGVLTLLLIPHLVLSAKAARFPIWARVIWEGYLVLALLFYLFALLVTFWKQKLDYEMRWYIVTDRSLRIRSGIWSVRELTMTFANVQNITVKQGPLQRILGIATVLVSCAGGSVAAGPHGTSHTSPNAARFDGVVNADEIRDLIQDRVKRYRDAGLGDEKTVDAARPAAASSEEAAARELLAETRGVLAALR